VSAFSGHVQSIPSTGAGQVHVVFGAPLGVSNANGTENAVQTLSPSMPINVSHLSVQETGLAVPPSDEIDATVRANGLTALSCAITAGQTACDSGAQTSSIPAGTPLSIGITTNASSGATIYSFDLLFGFEASS
jgi:hypothetical protein